MRAKISGRFWTVKYVPRIMMREGGATHECWGITHLDKREIQVNETLKGKRRLEILVHELIHACLPVLDESYVDQMGKDIANVLWKVGYRGEV